MSEAPFEAELPVSPRAAASFGRRRQPAIAEQAPDEHELAASAAGAPSPPGARPTSLDAIAELRRLCLSRLDPVAAAATRAERLTLEIERLIAEIATERRIQLNGREQRQLAGELVDDMLGLGPLEPLLADDSINDIMVNGPGSVFVERAGRLERVPVRFRDSQHVANICQRIAAAVGRRVDESSPMVDARLKDGSRVNIVLPPLALDGPCISIRKFARQVIDFARLIEIGSLTAPLARALEIVARCRLNVIISGGTGSGKTTLMNAMSRLIDPSERIVTVEDAAELQLQQPHVVRLETRPANLEGVGQITMRDLVKNCLRMRPERIVVGEVRGPEAFDLLQAMNTGHDGSMGTLHANSPREALSRIESMITMGGYALPMKTIREMVTSSVDVIIQASRLRDGSRRITHVTEVLGMEGDVVITQDLFVYEILGEDAQGKLIGRHRSTGIGRPRFWERARMYGEEARLAAALDISDIGAA